MTISGTYREIEHVGSGDETGSIKVILGYIMKSRPVQAT